MKSKLSVALAAAACASTLFASPASAATVTWTLENVLFAGGGSATGSYDYDASTNTFSNIHIVTTHVGPFGATYGVPPGTGTSVFFDTVPQLLPDYTGSPRFLFDLTSAMTDAAGVIPILVGEEAICSNANCSSGAIRVVVSGEVVATTPLPAALPLFATGLGVMGLLGWRRKRKAALAA